LISGKTVLFTGTGCQVNGLHSFLGKIYDNLICVDVICHGTPSPALWREYVKFQEEKSGGKMECINFRCKDVSWTEFGMKEMFRDDANKDIKAVYISKDRDSYMQMFLRDYCLRPSCYACMAKNQKKSDLTIADFWGINNVAADMNDDKGTSLVITRTDKGREVFERASRTLKCKEVSYKESIKDNPAEFKSCVRPDQRKTFFGDMYSMNFEELEKKYTAPIKVSFMSKIKRKIKRAFQLLESMTK
jgi:coenzyme F420-reducing hydrogenase beta subunit